MSLENINKQLKLLEKSKNIDDAIALVQSISALLGVSGFRYEELLMLPSIQREVKRFVDAPGFRNQAAAYEIPHDSGLPIDLKLFWIKQTTKANLSWLVALTPNYEDNPETNETLNLGIDIVVSEDCSKVYVLLSHRLKLRVLELSGSLTHTQREIFEQWQALAGTLDKTSAAYKEKLRAHLWKSFDFEPVNRKFYQELVTLFDHVVGHLKKQMGEEEAKMFTVRLIGRTLFLWFLRKKEFLNSEKEYFTVAGTDDQTAYYRQKLEPLFFEVLNTELRERSYDDDLTPFLNGGLFEPITTDFYQDDRLTFPPGFFAQFFDILDRFNFTVDEGTSEYEQVAVDPEMLGRVFENLLASLSDETGTQARKAKGAFYTPREIVDYMCEQSLIEYLRSKLPDTANRDARIVELVTMDEASFREQDHNKRRDWRKDLGQEKVIEALDKLRILDPAVGSGAFPMGMLNLLVKVYTRIDTARERDLATLKREILSRSLYGVDIDQMAIQICRLRAWLSILVDMESLNKVEPLPNLDFKFVCANTLIPLEEYKQENLFDAINLKEELLEIRDAYYTATRKTEKKKLRDKYLSKITDGGLFATLESERQRQLKDYNPFDPLNSSSFYDPELMHGVPTFSLVIGNPPYVNIRKVDKKYKAFYKEYYATASGQYDLYVLFIERGLNLVTDNGILTYITPNKFLVSAYAQALRKFLVNNVKLVDFVDHSKNNIFEGVGVYPVVFSLKREKNNVTESDDYDILDHFGFLEKSIVAKKLDEIELKLDDILIIKEAIHTGNIREKLVSKHEGKYKLLRGKDIHAYSINFDNLYIDYDYKINKELNEYANLPKKDIFVREKILLREIALRPTAAYDNSNFFCLNKAYVLYPKKSFKNVNLKVLTIILNSSLMAFYFEEKFGQIRVSGGYLQFKKQFSSKLPIVLPNCELEKKLEKKYDHLMVCKKTSDFKRILEDLDEIVMELYGLSDEEKKLIRNFYYA